jgi:hypothetical protein
MTSHEVLGVSRARRGMMVVEVSEGRWRRCGRKRPREEVRLCGLAGADEQRIWLSRTGEKVTR